MTSQIVVLNKKRSFVVTESAVIIDDFKSYEGEEKLFEISCNHSTVLLVSGNGRFNGENLKNYIVKFNAKINLDEIQTVEEIKTSLNDCISNSSDKIDVDEYIENTFPMFEENINNGSITLHSKKTLSNNEIKILDNNKLLDKLLLKLSDSLSSTMDTKELISILRVIYYDYLIKSSPNLVIVGYDDENEFPSFFKYSILFNSVDGLEIVEEYSLNNYYGTMIFAIAQNQDINLNLLGFNKKSNYQIKKIVSELFRQYMEDCDEKILNEILLNLEDRLFNVELENLSGIIEYIEFLPDDEILKLLTILIELTSIKKRFSNEPHSVGGRIVKAVLRKYNRVKFFGQ